MEMKTVDTILSFYKDIPLMHKISATPFDFNSSAFSINPGTCFKLHITKQQNQSYIYLNRNHKNNNSVYLQVGVKAPGTPKTMTFLPAARVCTDTSWSWSCSSKWASFPSGKTSPTAIGAISNRRYCFRYSYRVIEWGFMSKRWKFWLWIYRV